MKTKQWLFAAFTVLLLAGCSAETDPTRTGDVHPLIPEGMTQLSFDIKGVRTGTSYVALTQDEAQLKDLYVLLFPQSEDGPKPDAVCVASLRAKINTKDGVYKAAVLMDKTIPEGKYYATLVANVNAMMRYGEAIMPDEEWEAIFATLKGQTYTEIFTNQIVAVNRGLPMLPIADYGLGMKALVKDIDMTEADRGDVILLSATMTRPQARFDIKNTAYKSFTITGYKIYNVLYGTLLYFLDSDVVDDESGWGSDYPAVTLTDAQKTLLNTPSLDDDGNPDTPLVMTYNPAFYCYPGSADNESYVEITGELKVNTGGTRTVTYTIPLKTKVPDEYIAIQSNKRYKIELKMTETEQLEGDVTMDAGSWDDEGGTGTGNDNIEEQLPGEIRAVTGATYTEYDKTFNVAEGVNTFSFTFIVSVNTLRVAATTPGIVSKVEEATTLVVPSAKYTVTLAATGTDGAIEEIGKDKDGKEVVVNTYTVKREILAPTPPANVNGHKPVLYNSYWFVDPSPVGKDNDIFYSVEDAKDACPSGWHIPTMIEIKQIVKLPSTLDGAGKYENKDFANDFFGTMSEAADDFYMWLDDGPTCQLGINAMQVWWGGDIESTARCVQSAN